MRLSAPVWCMGIEEDLGNMASQDISENLKAHASFEIVQRQKGISLRELLLPRYSGFSVSFSLGSRP